MHIGNLVVGYSCAIPVTGIYLIKLRIADTAWSAMDYDQRLGVAKGLWAGCVKFIQPSSADDCHVRLIGEQDEDLGGSNDLAGSMIDVSKN